MVRGRAPLLGLHVLTLLQICVAARLSFVQSSCTIELERRGVAVRSTDPGRFLFVLGLRLGAELNIDFRYPCVGLALKLLVIALPLSLQVRAEKLVQSRMLI